MEKDHPRQRKALELHYFDGFKQKEVAELLDVAISTIENDLRFARAWLSKEWNATYEVYQIDQCRRTKAIEGHESEKSFFS